MPDTHCTSSALNDKAPTTLPKMPKGSKKVTNLRSKSLRNAARPMMSVRKSTGIRMAAACGTVTVNAMMGTTREPKPTPKPLLLTPSKSTAGTVTT